MSTKITIDPITRIEGHMKIEATVEDRVVKDAQCSGTLFRGFEIILRGRDPRDAQRITQRVCGVCPAVHGTAATLNLDSAFGIADKVPDNGEESFGISSWALIIFSRTSFTSTTLLHWIMSI